MYISRVVENISTDYNTAVLGAEKFVYLQPNGKSCKPIPESSLLRNL